MFPGLALAPSGWDVTISSVEMNKHICECNYIRVFFFLHIVLQVETLYELKNILTQFWFLPYILIRGLKFSGSDLSLSVLDYDSGFSWLTLPASEPNEVSAVTSKTQITSDSLSGVTRRDIYLNRVDGNTADELFEYKYGEILEVLKSFCSETPRGNMWLAQCWHDICKRADL